MSDEVKQAVKHMQHLEDKHGVMLTEVESRRWTVEKTVALWKIHGPHNDCGGLDLLGYVKVDDGPGSYIWLEQADEL